MSQPEQNLLEGGLLATLPEIEAVAFDAVGTVMYPKPSVSEAYRQAIQQHCGHEIESAEVARVVKLALTERSRDADLRTSEETERQFWADLIRRLCPAATGNGDAQSDGFQDCFDHLFEHFQRAENWRCFDDATGLIDELHRRGLQTAIASNFDQRLNAVCDGLPELKHVGHRVISSVVGWRKPAKPFFDAVSQQIGVAPNRILFVGDDLTNDVEGASAAGMRAAWVCRSAAGVKPTTGGAVTITSLRQLIGVNKAADKVAGVDHGSASIP